jgi:hypothetical protein
MIDRFLVTKKSIMKTGKREPRTYHIVGIPGTLNATDFSPEAVAKLAAAIADRLAAGGIAVGKTELVQQVETLRTKKTAIPVDMPAVKRDTGLEGSLGEIETKVGATIAPDIAEALKKVLGGNNEGNGT